MNWRCGRTNTTITGSEASSDPAISTGQSAWNWPCNEASPAESGDPTALPTDAAESLATHRVVWAAEHACLTGTVVRRSPQ
ncbi:hypothetical protein AB0K60_33775 [Thermopolyspora sp. NPDC052614]|uniref:hypothetical protein n=1 Tax=Thermopolyspora sp. NPDC052614 TaxID=3155682 RepID=UPI00341D3BDF